jgi:hypothetical protein
MRPIGVDSEMEPLFGDDDFGGVPEGATTLFGYDPTAQPYEISILADIDLGSKTLRGMSLAAINWGPDDKGRTIYYEEAIPAIPMGRLGGPDDGKTQPSMPGGWNGPGSGFEDFLRDEGEETGSDPA